MIKDFNHIVPRVIRMLEESKYEFQPTGSRFFGGYTIESDYDFIAIDSTEIREFLQSYGFVEDTKPDDYCDPTVNSIFRLQSIECNVDVQLATPEQFKCKLRSQEMLLNVFPIGVGLPGLKETKTALWRTLTTLLILEVIR